MIAYQVTETEAFDYTGSEKAFVVVVQDRVRRRLGEHSQSVRQYWVATSEEHAVQAAGLAGAEAQVITTNSTRRAQDETDRAAERRYAAIDRASRE